MAKKMTNTEKSLVDLKEKKVEIKKQTNADRKRIAEKQAKGREMVVLELYLKGYTYRYIENYVKDTDYKCSLPTIRKIITAALKDWKEWANQKIDDLKAVELQRINRLETIYFEAWENSKDDNTSESETENFGKDGKKYGSFKTKSKHKSYGDPRFLKGLEWCIAQRVKILGIEAPKEVKVDNNHSIMTKVVVETRKRSTPYVLPDFISSN